MAISHSAIQVMVRMLKKSKLTGTALTLGVQKIKGDRKRIAKLFAREGRSAAPINWPETEDGRPGQPGRIRQELLFSMLGFSKTESIDVFEDEKPTYKLDLNEPVPERMHGQYDLVCDGGTTEHCFNPPAVLDNVVRLLKPGGVVIHSTPISGWAMHGFYQLSPNLLFQYYAENGFTELDGRVVFGGRSLDPLEYSPRRDYVGQRALLVFVARKGEEIAKPRAPVQFRHESPELKKLMQGLNQGMRSGTDRGSLALFMPLRWCSDLLAAARSYWHIATHARRL